MPTIVVDMSSDGHKSVIVSDDEYEILCNLEKEYGSIHDAINKLPKNDEFRILCIQIMNRKPTNQRTFVFYM